MGEDLVTNTADMEAKSAATLTSSEKKKTRQNTYLGKLLNGGKTLVMPSGAVYELRKDGWRRQV